MRKIKYTVEFMNGFQHTEIYPDDGYVSWDMPSAIGMAKDSYKSAFGSEGKIARTEQEWINDESR